MPIAYSKEFLNTTWFLFPIDYVPNSLLILYFQVLKNCLFVPRIQPFAFIAYPLKSNHENISIVVTPKHVFMRIDEVIWQIVANLIEGFLWKCFVTNNVINGMNSTKVGEWFLSLQIELGYLFLLCLHFLLLPSTDILRIYLQNSTSREILWIKTWGINLNINH